MINEFFGFSENPFNATPDPKYLFLTESHQEALASMTYGIQEKKGFVCISGEIGTGKTTLIRHLLNTLAPSIKAVFIYHTLVSFEELLKEIVLELELPLGDQSKTHLIRQLNDYLIQRLSRDETLVLFIDEAQHLSQAVLEGLRLLSNLETERSKLLQMVLVGQVELEEKLNALELRQFKQRIGIWRHLKPLGEQESRKYIQHRLEVVGSRLEKVFTPEAVSLICQYAGGIPRTINILCDNACLIGYALSKKKVDEKIVEEVLGDMGLLNEGKRVDEKVSDESMAKGQDPGVVFIGYPTRTPAGHPPIIGTLTPQREETQEDPGVHMTPANTSQAGLARYRRSMVLAFVLMSLFLAGFVARGALPSFSEKTQPESFPPLPIQANYRDRTQAETQIKGTITVEKGETISSLAEKYYHLTNHTVMDYILTINRDITNPHYIRERQVIKLPEITEDSLIVRAGDGVYRIWLETFANADEVGTLKRDPSLAGRKIEVLLRPVSSTENWYRAVTGVFETREACLRAIQELKIKGVLSILKK
jgi:type II secretory pathway predicted ATPase ExeA